MTCLGSRTTAEALLRTLREAAPVEFDLLEELPISTFGEVAVEPTEPTPVMEHSLPNFTGEAQTNGSGYTVRALARLRAIKQARDPHSVIRSNKPMLGQ